MQIEEKRNRKLNDIELYLMMWDLGLKHSAELALESRSKGRSSAPIMIEASILLRLIEWSEAYLEKARAAGS